MQTPPVPHIQVTSFWSVDDGAVGALAKANAFLLTIPSTAVHNIDIRTVPEPNTTRVHFWVMVQYCQ